jgi:hypothetical protein
MTERVNRYDVNRQLSSPAEEQQANLVESACLPYSEALGPHTFRIDRGDRAQGSRTEALIDNWGRG